MTAPVEEGEVLAGKYRVERVLGVGGMGVVVAAMHLQLDERVALKFLLPEALQNAEAVERFAREARAAVKIKSEHVARVIDVGTLETGAPYMVMEYLEGEDLSNLLERAGPLSVPDAVDYLLQACEAIAEAHALGIVHRDLKPGNLFLTRRADGVPAVKVLDFGISKATVIGPGSKPDMSLTRTSTIMGSPLYMSPEQMKSTRNVDSRTDIWALGMILHELLSGRTAFRADTVPELCAKILTEPPAPIRDVRPDAPAAVEAAILRCLEKDPARRFQNVAELGAALVELGTKRARLSAERAHRVLRAAGIVTTDLLPPSGPVAGDARPEVTALLAQHASGHPSQAPAPGHASYPPAGASASQAPPYAGATGSGALGVSTGGAKASIASATVGPWAEARPPSRSGPKVAALLGVLLVAGLGGTWLFVQKGHDAGEAAVPAPPVVAAAAAEVPAASAPPSAEPVASAQPGASADVAPSASAAASAAPSASASAQAAASATPSAKAAAPAAKARPAVVARAPVAKATGTPASPAQPAAATNQGLFDDQK